jgi:cytosine/adenosine deaminase-related metal-dependent hydrolase
MTPPKTLRIENGLLITLDAERRIIQNGSIAIKGNKIVGVGKSEEIRRKFQADQVLDAREKVITPGFIDAHVHLSEHIIRGLVPDDAPLQAWLPDWLFPVYSILTPEEEYYSAMLAFMEMIRTGTTTFCEAGTLFDVGSVVQAAEAIGIRGIVGRWTWDLPQTPLRMKQTTEEALKQNEMLLSQINGSRNRSGNLDSRILAWPIILGIGTVSDELIKGAKRLADAYGVGFSMMHSATDPASGTKDTIPIPHLEELGVLDKNVKLVHMVYVQERDLELLRRYQVSVVHCPTAALRHMKGITRYGRFPEMLDKGICVALGGDSGNGSNHFNMCRIMYLVATLYKDSRMDVNQIPAETALEMATLHGARALLMQDQIGSIEVGKKADLVLFDTRHIEWQPLLHPINNLIYSVSGHSVDTVLIDGEIVLERGKFTKINEEEIYSKIHQLAKRLVQRSGLQVQMKWKEV